MLVFAVQQSELTIYIYPSFLDFLYILLLLIYFNGQIVPDLVGRSLSCLFDLSHDFSGFLGSSAGKGPACNAGDPGSIPESGSSPGEGIDYSLQYLGLPWWLRW